MCCKSPSSHEIIADADKNLGDNQKVKVNLSRNRTAKNDQKDSKLLSIFPTPCSNKTSGLTGFVIEAEAKSNIRELPSKRLRTRSPRKGEVDRAAVDVHVVKKKSRSNQLKIDSNDGGLLKQRNKDKNSLNVNQSDHENLNVYVKKLENVNETNVPLLNSLQDQKQDLPGSRQEIESNVQNNSIENVAILDDLDYFAQYLKNFDTMESTLDPLDSEDCCFLCKDGGDLIECDHNYHKNHKKGKNEDAYRIHNCKKVYHEYCLSFPVEGDAWTCPRHYCTVCFRYDEKLSFYVCKFCPITVCAECTKVLCEVHGYQRYKEEKVPKSVEFPSQIVSSARFITCHNCLDMIHRGVTSGKLPPSFAVGPTEVLTSVEFHKYI